MGKCRQELDKCSLVIHKNKCQERKVWWQWEEHLWQKRNLGGCSLLCSLKSTSMNSWIYIIFVPHSRIRTFSPLSVLFYFPLPLPQIITLSSHLVPKSSNQPRKAIKTTGTSSVADNKAEHGGFICHQNTNSPLKWSRTNPLDRYLVRTSRDNHEIDTFTCLYFCDQE